MPRISYLVLGLLLSVGSSVTARSGWQDDLVIGRLRQRQPQILINDRISAPADWRTREGADRLGEYDNVQPWELCVTLAGTWGYQPNAQPRSLRELVLLLTNTAARDGNLLALPESTPGMPTIIVELTYDRSVMEVLPRSL